LEPNKYADGYLELLIILDEILNFREDVSLERQKLINDFIENGYL